MASTVGFCLSVSVLLLVGNSNAFPQYWIPPVDPNYTGCPFSNPYAYNNGKSCCFFGQEADNRTPLTLESQTCKNDHSRPCQHENNGCRSIQRDTCYLDRVVQTDINTKQDCLANGSAEKIEWAQEVREGTHWRDIERCTKSTGQPEKCIETYNK